MQTTPKLLQQLQKLLFNDQAGSPSWWIIVVWWNPVNLTQLFVVSICELLYLCGVFHRICSARTCEEGVFRPAGSRFSSYDPGLPTYPTPHIHPRVCLYLCGLFHRICSVFVRMKYSRFSSYDPARRGGLPTYPTPHIHPRVCHSLPSTKVADVLNYSTLPLNLYSIHQLTLPSIRHCFLYSFTRWSRSLFKSKFSANTKKSKFLQKHKIHKTKQKHVPHHQ